MAKASAVTFLRKKSLAAAFFLLISLGQAYPYAVAWAHIKQVECGCRSSGRDCIHGCDLKKRAAKKKSSHDHSGHAQMAGADHTGHHKVSKAKEEKSSTPWIAPRCAEEKEPQSASFISDPFIPSKFQVNLWTPATQDLGAVNKSLSGQVWACDSPPPKGEEAPPESDR